MKTALKPYPKYKDSGIEWVGVIPEHWELNKIKFISQVHNGSTPKSDVSEYWDGDIIWLTPDDLGKFSNKEIDSSFRKITVKGLNSCGTTMTHRNSIVLSTRAPIGHIGITSVESCTNQGCKTIVPNESLVKPVYLFYSLFSSKEELQSLGQGSTFMELPTQKLKDYRIPYLPITEQTSVASYLDRKTEQIDSFIEKKKKMIALLKEYRTAVINNAVTKGLNPNVKMKDSGIEWLGDIPEHWELKRLKFISPKITVGIVVTPAKFYVDEGVPALRSLNIKEYKIDGNNMVYISHESNELHHKSKIYERDLVSVRTGQPGTTTVVNKTFDGVNCIDLIIIRKSKNFNSNYLSCYLNSECAKSQYLLGSGGAIQQHFNISTAEDLLIPLPPRNEQDEIANYLSNKYLAIEELIAKEQDSVSLLKQYRTALISNAVTGKIDIRDNIAA